MGSSACSHDRGLTFAGGLQGAVGISAWGQADLVPVSPWGQCWGPHQSVWEAQLLRDIPASGVCGRPACVSSFLGGPCGQLGLACSHLGGALVSGLAVGISYSPILGRAGRRDPAVQRRSTWERLLDVGSTLSWTEGDSVVKLHPEVRRVRLSFEQFIQSSEK